MTHLVESFGEGEPTVIAVTAPWCTVCRAMEPALQQVAERYRRRVHLKRLDLSEDPAAASALAIKGTPTLVGVVEGKEVFRVTGRRSVEELDRLFEHLALPGSPPPPPTSRTDVIIRTGAGGALALAGLVAGPAWQLVVVGLAVTAWGAWGWSRRRA